MSSSIKNSVRPHAPNQNISQPSSALQRKCCGTDNRLTDQGHDGGHKQSAQSQQGEPGFAQAAFGHDFSKIRVHSDGQGLSGAINDQTPGESEEEPSKEITKPAVSTTDTDTDVEQESGSNLKVDRIDFVTSSSGAVGGYPAKEDKCDASLSKPEPFNDTKKGPVANVHQVHFHMSRGKPESLTPIRVVDRTATGGGKVFTKSGNDGPPAHEQKTTDEKLVVADAPGWCNTVTQSDFPLTYKGDFALYAFDLLSKSALASVSYQVEISKASLSDASAVNTVKVKDKKIGGAVPSPVKPKK